MYIIRFLDNRHYQYGPFKTADAAVKFAAKQGLTTGWVIQKLTSPTN